MKRKTWRSGTLLGALVVAIVACVACGSGESPGPPTNPSVASATGTGDPSAEATTSEIDYTAFPGFLMGMDHEELLRVQAIYRDEIEPGWRDSISQVADPDTKAHLQRLAKVKMDGPPLSESQLAYLEYSRRLTAEYDELVFSEIPEQGELLSGEAEGKAAVQ